MKMSLKMKAKRIEKDIKQQEFAKMLGITPQYLRRIEKGEIDVKRSFMIRASRLLDTPVDELFFDK